MLIQLHSLHYRLVRTPWQDPQLTGPTMGQLRGPRCITCIFPLNNLHLSKQTSVSDHLLHGRLKIFSTKIAISKTQSQGPQLADYKATLNLVIFQCKPLTSENNGKPSNEKNISSMENDEIRNMYNSISLSKDSVSTQPTNPNL